MAETTKNVDENRFEIHVDGKLAGFVDYQVADLGVIELPHTEVDEAYSGQGLAGQLVQFALDDIRSQGYLVNPICPYVKSWIEKHPDYADLVAPERLTESAQHDAIEDMEDVTGVSKGEDKRL